MLPSDMPSLYIERYHRHSKSLSFKQLSVIILGQIILNTGFSSELVKITYLVGIKKC